MLRTRFKDNWAQDGSIIYMLEGANVKLEDADMSHGKAQRNGGAIYAGGTAGTP